MQDQTSAQVENNATKNILFKIVEFTVGHVEVLQLGFTIISCHHDSLIVPELRNG
jgi:hypothetical protein